MHGCTDYCTVEYYNVKDTVENWLSHIHLGQLLHVILHKCQILEVFIVQSIESDMPECDQIIV